MVFSYFNGRKTRACDAIWERGQFCDNYSRSVKYRNKIAVNGTNDNQLCATTTTIKASNTSLGGVGYINQMTPFSSIKNQILYKGVFLMASPKVFFGLPLSLLLIQLTHFSR